MVHQDQSRNLFLMQVITKFFPLLKNVVWMLMNLISEHPFSGGRGLLSVDGNKWIGIVDSTHEDAKIQLEFRPQQIYS